MKFSILIPCFDLAPWIRVCLDSVRAQTCGDWECVAVDDGSSDGTAAILDEYAAKDGRFRVLHQRTSGVGAARNAALAVARGEWILFLDGDDVLAPTALAQVGEAVSAHPGVQAVRFGYERFEDAWAESTSAVASRPSIVDILQYVPMSALRSYLWQFAFRREAVGDLRFTHYRRGEDRLFVVEALLKRLNGYVELGESLYGYRRRPGSAMLAQADRQTLLDELDHRLDVVRMVLATEKRIDFSDPAWYDWIEDYFLNHRRLLRPVKGEWLARLAELGRLPGLTRRCRRLVRRQKSYRKFGAEDFPSYCRIRLSCLLSRLAVHRLLLPMLRARKYGHIIPIGATCEVAYRFYHTWGFLDSSLLSWAGTYTVEQLNAVLRDLPSLLTGDVAFEDRRLLWRCLNTQVDFHGQLKRINGKMPSDEAKAADLAALRGRAEYLKGKLLRYLRDDEETLLVRRLGLDDVTPDLGARLDELERTIAGLGARNWKLLVICEAKDLAKMPAGPNRVFRSVRRFNPPDLVTEPDCGDTIGWKAIFTEFAPARILPKKHDFKFE